MKKQLLLLFTICTLAFNNSKAQLPNASFENWGNIESIWGYAAFIPLDTFSFLNPIDWTTLNQVTGSQYLGGNYYVSQSNVAATGSYGIRLETDTVVVGLLPDSNLILPGFILNGTFQVDLGAILDNSGIVSPAIFPGAGTPETNRKGKLRFKAKYAPVQNDSLLAWAVLKKNGVIVAEAKLNDTQAYPTYTTLEADFVYLTCDEPDTVVIMIGSSTPNFSTAFSGNSELLAGSVLYVDDIELIDLPGATNIPPIANFDEALTFVNIPKTIGVLENDIDCENVDLSLSIASQPLNGTATVVSGDSIKYIPNSGYAGADTLYYTISDGTFEATTFVRINVFVVGGEKEESNLSFSLIPNPANEMVFIDAPVSAMKGSNGVLVVLYDLQGRKVLETKNHAIDLNNINKGIYICSLTINGMIGYRRLIVE